MEVKFLVDIDLEQRTGLFSAVVERVACVPQSVVYNLSYFDSIVVLFLKKLLGQRGKIKKKGFELAGVFFEPVHVKADAFHYLSRVFGFLAFYIFRRDSKNLREKIGEGQYILSAHWGVTSGLLAHFMCSRTKTKYVVTYHGSDIHTLPRRNYWLRQLVLKSLNNSEVNIFVSNASLAEARALGYEKNNSIVIYNGVNKDRFASGSGSGGLQGVCHPDEFFEGSPVVGYVGNMWLVKGADYLPQICNAILTKNPKVKFIFAGDGEYLEAIRSAVPKDKIVFLGIIDPEAIAEVMCLLDVLMIPSRNEGFPLVLLEALASGVNVIASKVGGMPEVLTEDFLVDPGDNFIECFAQKVVSVLEEGGNVYLEDCFDWRCIREQERRVYSAIQ